MHDYSKMRFLMTFTLIFVILLFVGSSIFSYFWLPNVTYKQFGDPSDELSNVRIAFLSTKLFIKMFTKVDGDYGLDNSVTFNVEPGKSAQQIAVDLESAGLINDAEYLSLYWEYKGFDRFIREGVYLINPGDTVLEIGNNLSQGESGVIRFAFLPGWRKEEIDFLLLATQIIPSSENIHLKTCFTDRDFGEVGVEGFLLAGEYQIPSGYSTEDIYCLFVENFFANISQDYIDQLETEGLTLYEGIILASMVEKEMVDKSEAATIAGVFMNRLKIDMPLQSDPTVQYAVASAQEVGPWWKSDLSKQDLVIDSPYNTYLFKGLPPTPICNPSLDALRAVANAESHNYFYFRAACDQSGRHIFSETYEQHLAAACE